MGKSLLNIIVAVAPDGGIGLEGKLPWRLNAPPGALLARGLQDCMHLLDGKLASEVDKIFIIGGSQLYKEVIEQIDNPVRIYCTHVLNQVPCDTFFPSLDWTSLQKVDCPGVPADVVEENGFRYNFAVYELNSN